MSAHIVTMQTTQQISVTQQVVDLLNRGRKREQIVEELLAEGHEAYFIKNLVEETYQMRTAKLRSQGLILILIGAVICLLSCILTITTTSSLSLVLFGLTTVGILFVFGGLVKIFG
ncbi:MAG: hypothetical protein R2800_15370 [Flavipsychrobacter sp.]